MRVAYLARNPICHHCLELGLPTARCKPANQVHHTAGKEGQMLVDTRFFMAVNSVCHTVDKDSIHENVEDAHHRGWLLSRFLDSAGRRRELRDLRGSWDHVRKELALFNSMRTPEETE